MNTLLPSSRQTADLGRQTPARFPIASADEPAPLDCPSVKEVIGEIGIVLAIHLAAALAISLTLSAYGIA